MRVAFATCDEWPHLTPDDQLAIPHLAVLGIEVVPYIWDAAPPSDIAAIVLRSCWDYHVKTDDFTRWLSHPPAPLLNPPEVLQWNLHKTYLEDLRRWDFHVPKTAWVNGPTNLLSLLQEHEIDHAVVKPVVGMNGFDTWRTSLSQAADQQAQWEALVGARAVMLQEFIPEVLHLGETSLIFFGGHFSHAVLKRARAGEFRIHEEYGGTRSALVPAPSLVQQAEQILAHLPSHLLYARIDGIVSNGHFVIMEIELIDPALFLAFDPWAPTRFATAIAKAVSELE